MKYLHQITNENERKYIEDYVSSVENTGIILSLLFKFNVIIPFMLFKISIPQFINVFLGYAGIVDFFIAFGLFIFGIFFAFGCYYLGFKNPLDEKRFLKQVKNGELCIRKIRILKTLKTSNSNGHISYIYVTDYIDEDGKSYKDKLIKAYGYNASNRYENGILYNDVTKGNAFMGIIPIQA